MSDSGDLTYTLLIWLENPCTVIVGALGERTLPRGLYRYVGSARRNTAARLWRHLGHRPRRLRWHIDYLLSQPTATVIDVRLMRMPECRVNQRLGGAVPIPGFGASDCRSGCGSHLRYLGSGIDPDHSSKDETL